MHRYVKGFGKRLETKEGLTRLRQWPTSPRSTCLQWWAEEERADSDQKGEDGNILPVFICLHMVSSLRPGPSFSFSSEEIRRQSFSTDAAINM